MAGDSSIFLKACRRQPVERIPVWFMRQAGRYLEGYRKIRAQYDILTICKTPELACKVTLEPVQLLGVDAAILFSDLLLPFEAMGVTVRFAKGEGPLIVNPIKDARSIHRLTTINPDKDLSCVLEAIRLIKKELKGKVPLIGFGGAPFTLASYLIEGGHSNNYLKTKALMHQEPKTWGVLMDKLTDAMLGYLKAQARAGVEAIQVFDSWVGSLSPQDYKEYVFPYSKRLWDGLKTTGAPVIHFGTQTSGLLNLMKEAGGDVLGIDWRIPIDLAWQRIGFDRAIQGNLDPAVLLTDQKTIKAHVLDILERVGDKPGFIFNLGHGILPQTPVNNARLVVDLVHQWHKKK